MNEELRKMLADINDDDKKTMFGTAFTTAILTKLDVEEKLTEYLNYDVPVNLGDIIEYQEKRYVVTCIYTDNSVDILSEDAKKQNVGFYMKNVKVIGKLQVIQED